MNQLKQVSADKTSIGFEYQDLVLVGELLSMEPGQAVGFELYDDIHVETVESALRLMQVKHSLVGGNVTERDIDLWKTLYNWYQSLDELPKDKEIQFVLFTNKSLNNQELIEYLRDAPNKKDLVIQKIAEIATQLLNAEAKKSSTDASNPILKYAHALAEASSEKISYILDRFKFEIDTDFITNQIDKRLKYFAVPEERIKDTRDHVLGAYKTFKIDTIRAGTKVVIDFETFRNRIGFDRILTLARAVEPDFDRFYDNLIETSRYEEMSFLQSIFGKQLSEIGFDTSTIIERGIDMVVTEDLIGQLQKEGTFSILENRRLENQTVYIWRQVHRSTHTNLYTCESMHTKAAKQCYQRTSDKELMVREIRLPEGVRNGIIIKLSNSPVIGWRSDWEVKYRK